MSGPTHDAPLARRDHHFHSDAAGGPASPCVSVCRRETRHRVSIRVGAPRVGVVRCRSVGRRLVASRPGYSRRPGGRRAGRGSAWASRNAATPLPAGMYPTCRTRRGVAQLGSASALGAEGRGFKSRHPDHLRDHLARPYTVIAFGACRRCRYYASCTPVCLILWISTGSPPGGESAGAALAPAETKKSAPKETEP